MLGNPCVPKGYPVVMPRERVQWPRNLQVVGSQESLPHHAQSPHAGTGRSRRLLKLFATCAALGVVIAALAFPVVGGVALAARDSSVSFSALPSVLNAPPLPQRTVLLAKDGSTIATVFTENRTEVPLTSIAPIMRQAIVAIEDARFYQHGGVDLRGTLRAIRQNQQAGGVKQGASTLTQQYIKNVLLENARTLDERNAARSRTLPRKIREIRLAVALEKRFTKDQILERYLNTVYFGDGAYGIQAAAQRYFGVNAADLSLAQAATLAGVVQQPLAYNPRTNTVRAQARRDVVIERMLQLGMIQPSQATKAKAISLGRSLNITSVANGCATSYAAYFCEYVLNFLRYDPYFGPTQEDRDAFLRRGGLTIRTTLDPRLQAVSQQAVNAAIPATDKSQKATATASVQPGTGAVLAMAQNRVWGLTGRGRTTVNFSVDTKYGGSLGAQAGSTFKVFVLAAALDQGLPITTTLRSPATRTFTGFTDCTTGAPFGPYTVSNSTGSGTYSMRTATAESVNTFFVGLEKKTGLCRPKEIAEALGVRRATGQPLKRIPSFVLGSQAVSPLAMAEAYATFAARGTHCRSVPVTDVTDRDGVSLGAPPANCQEVIKPAVADAVNDLLTAVMTQGTGKGLGIGRPVAGKTGTTDQNAAVWFVGHTPQLATAVWIGDPRGGQRYPIRDITINGRFITKGYGGRLAGPIWQQIMQAGVQGLPVIAFTKPDPSVIAGLSTKVPDLRGLDPAFALQVLADAGLKGDLASTRVRSSRPENTVAFTYPSRGSFVTSGRSVVLYLSDGSQPVVPFLPLYTPPAPDLPVPNIPSPTPRATLTPTLSPTP